MAWHELFETSISQLLGTFADDLHAYGPFVAKCAKRGEMGDDVALAIGGAALVPATVTFGQLPHRAFPRSLIERWLDVVVEIQQHRRRPGRSWRVTAHRHAAVGRLMSLHILHAGTGEQLDRQVDHPLAVLVRAGSWVVDGLERDHPRQVLSVPEA